MICQRIAVLCVILALSGGTGCAGRHRVSTGRSITDHSNRPAPGRAGDSRSNGIKGAISALRESLRQTKPAAGAQQQPQVPSVSQVDPTVGTSRQWVVTVTTQRPDGAAAATAPQPSNTVNAPATARAARARAIGVTWIIPVLMVALVLAVCVRVLVRSRRPVDR
jgi:hypothetical protein